MLADVTRFVRPAKPWRLRLNGGSMSPNILEGDELLVEPGRAPRFGDVVVFPNDRKLVAHRVIGTVTEIRRSGRIVDSNVRSAPAALKLRARLALKYYLRLTR